MGYLYHFAPTDMRGETLYPLNQLRDIYPDVYEREAAKYRGREQLKETVIPTLGCLWNDVLFLMAVHPADIRRVAESVGLRVRSRLRMWRFDSEALDHRKLTVRFHRKGKGVEYSSFDSKKFDEYRVFEEDSIAYYREAMDKGRRPMLPGHIPHIMYQGTLGTIGVSIVEG